MIEGYLAICDKEHRAGSWHRKPNKPWGTPVDKFLRLYWWPHCWFWSLRTKYHGSRHTFWRHPWYLGLGISGEISGRLFLSWSMVLSWKFHPRRFQDRAFSCLFHKVLYCCFQYWFQQKDCISSLKRTLFQKLWKFYFRRWVPWSDKAENSIETLIRFSSWCKWYSNYPQRPS